MSFKLDGKKRLSRDSIVSSSFPRGKKKKIRLSQEIIPPCGGKATRFVRVYQSPWMFNVDDDNGYTNATRSWQLL